jgi:3-oxoacyl-[acyl-carrier-protein] synthase II
MRRRVVVTGMGGVSPLGSGWRAVRRKLRGGISGVSRIPEWAACEGLEGRLGARAE